jgi:Protein of unknown function (DUF3618)
MDQSTHQIQREREQTRAALTEKIDLLEERVRATKLAVKQKFDYRYQTARQPWKVLGAAVAFGYLAGKIFKSAPPPPRPAPLRETEKADIVQKSTLKGAVVGAVVPMLIELVKTASLRALSSRYNSAGLRARGQARVLTPFRDEPARYPAVATTKPLVER